MTAARATISVDQRRALLVRRHQLGPPFHEESQHGPGPVGPLDIADSLVALHSSDPVTVYLSLMARLPTATTTSIGQCLYRARQLARVHGMRRTLWVGSPEVVRDIVAASSARLFSADHRRLVADIESAGITSNGRQWIAAAAAELAEFIVANGPCDTRSIGDALPHLTVGFEGAPGKKYSATIAVHGRVLRLLGFKGEIVRADPLGSWIASQYRWAVPEQWLGYPLVGRDGEVDGPATIEKNAQTAMIGRYLRRFGPVTETDIKWWTGWPLGVVRRALTDLEAVEVSLEGTTEQGWMAGRTAVEVAADVGAKRANTTDSSVAVLPGLDPTTMGWKIRSWYVEAEMVGQLFDRNGNGGPTVWADGKIVGGWAQRDNGEMVFRLLADVGREVQETIGAKLEELSNRLDATVFKVRFPNPLNTELRR